MVDYPSSLYTLKDPSASELSGAFSTRLPVVCMDYDYASTSV